MANVYYLKDSMKKIALIVTLFVFFGCGNKAVEKPENLIEKEKMVDILYDLAVIQSIEVSKPGTFLQNEIKVNEVIYKKYGIDSVTFAQSNRYYASDAHNYQKLFQKVSEKLNAKKEELNKESVEKTGKPIAPSDAPSIQ